MSGNVSNRLAMFEQNDANARSGRTESILPTIPSASVRGPPALPPRGPQRSNSKDNKKVKNKTLKAPLMAADSTPDPSPSMTYQPSPNSSSSSSRPKKDGGVFKLNSFHERHFDTDEEVSKCSTPVFAIFILLFLILVVGIVLLLVGTNITVYAGVFCISIPALIMIGLAIYQKFYA
eukprot:TRINITY_DN2226_c0_g1_i1.p1 TRINITY_DN2226_c0_g1~~TRINITY_DN2226_c0_g1_i1.p1  ORF type:complete len:177 (-),score=20.57 TRINITY_DN2226_c0_g1_i1:99-629(-)